ncbi:MAG: thioesterase family protein [Brachymonas sp.]|nr:thioesterase family protein [Brachymonas sp.]
MKLPFPDQKRQIFFTRMSMRWGDMDAYGHANNAIYLRYFEEARILWITSPDRPHMAADGTGPVVANIFCNFYRPLEYPAEMLIKLYVTEPGRSSCEVWMTIERTDQPGVIHADGGATMVWIDFAQQKAVPLPDWLREMLTASEAPVPSST